MGKDLPVQRESPRRRLLGEVQEGEEGRVALAIDAKVVQTALPGSEPVRLETGIPAGQAAEQGPAPGAEERGMAQLVLGMAQEEAPQQRIAGQLGGARQIARAVRLGLREAQELPRAAVRIEPHPRVHRQQGAVDCGGPDGIPHPRNASTG